ncbi:hypothetical protein [Chitinimonas naiadis]
MDRLIAGCALGAFLLALLVHILALCGIDISAQLPFVWLLKFGIFAVFVPLIEATTASAGTNTLAAHPLAHCPLRARLGMACIVAYAFINFLICEARSPNGTLIVSSGGYTLQGNHGEEKEMTATEYRHYRANEIRSASGHWLVFYSLPFVFFLYRRRTPTTPQADTPPR